MNRKRAGILLLLMVLGAVSTAFSETFTFDSNEQKWQTAGVYDGGGLVQVPDNFYEGLSAWSDPFGLGGILIGSGGFQMPDSPTNDQYLHWDLNSPDLGNNAQWQAMNAFSYDVTGEGMSSMNSIYVQAVLRVQRPDGSIAYFTDQIFNEIPLASAGEWDTYAVDVESLRMPTGTIVRNVNLRFFFESGSGHDGYIVVDNVVPIGSQDDRENNSIAWEGSPQAISNFPSIPIADVAHLPDLMEQFGNQCAGAQRSEVKNYGDSDQYYFGTGFVSIDYPGDVDWYVVEIPAIASEVEVWFSSPEEEFYVEHFWGCGQAPAEWVEEESSVLTNSHTPDPSYLFVGDVDGAGDLYIKVQSEIPNATGYYSLTVRYRADWDRFRLPPYFLQEKYPNPLPTDHFKIIRH